MNQNLKKRVYEFIELNHSMEKVQIWEHFKLENAAKATIYRHISSWQQNKPVGRKIGTGRPTKIATKANIRKISKMFNNRSGCSQNKAARKIGCSQQYISKILKTRTGIVKRKKQKIPNRSLQQKQVAPSKCRKMTRRYQNFNFILDDESYFTLSNSTLAGNDIFYTDNLEDVPEDARYKKQSKFEKKVLVWIAISPKGMSSAYFLPAGLAINQDVYLEECLKKHLLPFIRKYHVNDNYVFWPDLASSHYARKVTTWLEEQNIDFVPRDINPANLPEVRPIEDFWAYLKRKVYADNFQAKTVAELTVRIKSCLRKVDIPFVCNLAATAYKRLSKVSQEGIKA
jgi:hypothetical protein